MSSKTYAFWISLTAALGGFLFGFDTAVISGAERAIQEVWKLNDWVHGLAIASALYGTVIGALLGGIPADRMGRKKSLFWIGMFYFISAVGSGIAWDVTRPEKDKRTPGWSVHHWTLLENPFFGRAKLRSGRRASAAARPLTLTPPALSGLARLTARAALAVQWDDIYARIVPHEIYFICVAVGPGAERSDRLGSGRES
jgi:MFS family permease